MKEAAFPKPQPSGSGPSTTTLFVSLYLVMLSFFIMLSSVALMDAARTKEAVHSLTQAFQNEPDAPTLQKKQLLHISGKERGMGVEAYFAQIKSYIEETIKVIPEKSYIEGNTLYLAIPTKELFIPDTATLLESKKMTLAKVADSLTPKKPGTQVDVEFLMAADNAMLADKLDIARSGVLARYMLGLGVKRNTLSIGVAHSDKGIVMITFRLRSVDEAASRIRL